MGNDYEIRNISNSEYIIVKYEHGFQEAEYTVSKKNNKSWRCSCISGHIRGYCKHKDWVKLIREGKTRELPEFVRIFKSIDGEKARREVLASLQKVAKVKHAKVKR